jgi:hypothetical protein
MRLKNGSNKLSQASHTMILPADFFEAYGFLGHGSLTYDSEQRRFCGFGESTFIDNEVKLFAQMCAWGDTNYWSPHTEAFACVQIHYHRRPDGSWKVPFSLGVLAPHVGGFTICRRTEDVLLISCYPPISLTFWADDDELVAYLPILFTG